MLKAGALLYAVVIALLMAIISSSLILYAYFNRFAIDSLLLKERLDDNAISGINLLISDPELFKPDIFEPYDLFGSGTDSILVKRVPWGMYEVAVCKAFSGIHESIKYALYGASVLSDTNSYALYLADAGDQLSITGHTVIKGNCFVPGGSIKRGYIEGQSFSGAKTSEGQVYSSKKNLPLINKDVVERNKVFFQKQSILDKDMFTTDSISSKDSIYNSFENAPLVIPELAELKDVSITGNVIIVSANQINISKSALLENVIIYAPEISIEDDFRGTLQAFASENIVVGDNVHLEYPSSLTIITDAKRDTSATISIGENCEIQGCLTLVSESEKGNLRDKISLGKNSSVYGQVYCDSYFELKGSVYGQVLCNKFILKTPSSMYENNLLGCTIDNAKLPANFAGSMLLERKIRQIAEWLPSP
ncbi:MAG: hypothetical protein AB7P01_15585 [Bacteroidia bacterium]